MTATETIEGAIVPHQPQSLAIANTAMSLLPVEVMRPVLDEYTTRRKTFRGWLLEQLRPGVHYGVPPGCAPKTNAAGMPVDEGGRVIPPEQWTFKPSLYKAGADFICDLLQLDPRFSPDAEAWRMLGSPNGTIVMKCELFKRPNSAFFPERSEDKPIGEGRGAAAAGQKRRDANAAIKVAEKSAKVDAVINALGLSDLFTQDLENQPITRQKPDADNSTPQVGTREERKSADTTPRVTGAMLNDLFALWNAKRAKGKGSKEGFLDFCCSTLHVTTDLSTPGRWTIDGFELVKGVLA